MSDYTAQLILRNIENQQRETNRLLAEMLEVLKDINTYSGDRVTF